MRGPQSTAPPLLLAPCAPLLPLPPSPKARDNMMMRFSKVTPEGGYEGGIITPGPALVTRYLHERTAQLPLVTDLQTPVESVIGKSTAEAIRIGATVGFAGLIQTLLDAVLAEYAVRRLPSAEIFLSGGAAQAVQGRLRLPARVVPDLALTGLAAAYALNRPA